MSIADLFEDVLLAQQLLALAVGFGDGDIERVARPGVLLRRHEVDDVRQQLRHEPATPA